MGGMFSDLKQLEQRPTASPNRSTIPPASAANRLAAIPRNRATADEHNSVSADPRISGTATSRSSDAVSASPQAGKPGGFDLAEKPYKSHGFLWTKEEIWALKDIENDLERRYDIETSLQELIRCALHMLVEDYRQQGSSSFALRRISSKRK